MELRVKRKKKKKREERKSGQPVPSLEGSERRLHETEYRGGRVNEQPGVIARLLEEGTEAGKPRRADKIYRAGHGLCARLLIFTVSLRLPRTAPPLLRGKPSMHTPAPLLAHCRSG